MESDLSGARAAIREQRTLRMSKTFYILDGYYQIYRAFYAPFPELNSPSGEPTKATHVFCQMLLNLLRDRRPDYLAMAMDAPEETIFRNELDDQYKANRDPAPEALHTQADRIREIVETLGIPLLHLDGFEADDLMATAAERLRDQDVEVYLVSRDKDLEQLITDRVFLFDASKNFVLDADALMEKKGYTPQQAVEIQTLTGDSTDNIPGVPGIGPKTAVKLINQYGSAQGVLENADKLTPKQSERVKAFVGQLPITRQLVTLRRDAPMELSLEPCRTDNLKFAAARPIFEQLGFNRLTELLSEFSGDDESAAPATAKAPSAPQAADYHLIDDCDKLDTFVAALSAQPAFAFDTETTGLNPVAADLVGLSFSWKRGEAYYLPVRSMLGKVLPLDDVVAQLKSIFEDPDVAKIGQNLKYDVLMLRQVGIEVNGLAFDTMIADFLLDPLARSHSLDGMANRFFGHEMIPIAELIGKGKNQITIDMVDLEQVCHYAAEDADFTWRIYEILAPKMSTSPVQPLFRDTEMPLIEVLTEMEHNGTALDADLLRSLGTSMGERLEELTKEVHAAAGHEFNIDSPKQLSVVLFDEQGLEVIRKTKTGRSTDADTLTTLAAKTDNPIPKLILAYRELAKLKSTYVDTLPKMVLNRTRRLHASFDQIGAITGRLSSSSPNLQNIPIRTETGRRIREAFVAQDPGDVLLAADYSQVELRLLAHFCKDPALIEAFRSGEDIHRTVAAQVNGVNIDDVTPQQRSAAKAVNFGIIYGQSAFGLARSLGIPMNDAKAFIDTYFERFPEIRAFIDECIRSARDRGYAETVLGRRRPITELQSRNRQEVALGERLAVNTVVQGSAADLIKLAMIDIHRAYKAGEHQARMIIQVHDELVFELPASCLESDAALIRTKMQSAMELDVPLTVDIASGRTWAQGK